MLWPEDDFGRDEVLCINFVNTVSWRGKANPTEYLENLESWLSWVKEEGLATEESLAELLARGDAEAVAAFERAIQFRESLYHFLKAFARSEDPPAKDRLLVQDVLGRALGRLKLAESSGKWGFELEPGLSDWDALLFPCALSAAQLVAGPWAQRLRVCGREECLWLFLDLTKNRSRKWCDMTTCGNVVKARRRYAAQKATQSIDDVT
jgi:predicted RNA-binding Zn ribbon-like protein